MTTARDFVQQAIREGASRQDLEQFRVGLEHELDAIRRAAQQQARQEVPA